MKRVSHPIYRDYPEQPYISPERDLEKWIREPEAFPYGIVERRQMVRTEEGLLPGDVVMLWRVHFGNFTSASWIPEYFEYRYGVSGEASLALLREKGFIRLCSADESLSEVNMNQLKRLLRSRGLAVGGRRADLLKRVREGLSPQELEAGVALRKYQITERGAEVLSRHDEIIRRHGPKNL